MYCTSISMFVYYLYVFLLFVSIFSEILLDILPTVQRPEIATVLIDLLRDETVRGIRSRVSIAAMSLVAKPEPEIVRSLIVSNYYIMLCYISEKCVAFVASYTSTKLV